MKYTLYFTDEALKQLELLEKNKHLNKRHKAVRKALGYLENNPKHPGLNTHKYTSIKGVNGEEIFEAYAENKTPSAFRIFWSYGPGKHCITIYAITAHP